MRQQWNDWNWLAPAAKNIRTIIRIGIWTACWGVLGLASCFAPVYPVGILCSGNDTCPPGQSCDVDGVCRIAPQQGAQCGNGIVEPDEICDDGNTEDNDECSADCKRTPACGDGVIDPGEACDDGNIQAGDGCSTQCTLERCGNGTLDSNELCDNGAQCADGRTCVTNDQCADIGDSLCAPRDGDGCSANCLSTETCGNTIVDVVNDEDCDNGPENTPDCDRDCSFPACGDGLVNPLAPTAGPERNQNEECDTGGNSPDCDNDCTIPRCGDGLLNPTAQEACDDGNLQDGDGCSSECQEELLCGNNALDPGEDLDPPVGPSESIPVDSQTCRYDFSGITQIYCNGTCGNWDGINGCQSGDADVLCKLKTDNPQSVAVSFEVGIALAEPGLCCPPPTLPDPAILDCIGLGQFTDRGVELAVAVHDSDLQSTHGETNVITNVICTDPAPDLPAMGDHLAMP